MKGRKKLGEAIEEMKRNPEKNYEANFVIFHNGQKSYQTRKITAPNGEAAWRKALDIASNGREFKENGIVRIPKQNIKAL